MNRLLLALLLFSSPLLAKKYTIYKTERPPQVLGQALLILKDIIIGSRMVMVLQKNIIAIY